MVQNMMNAPVSVEARLEALETQFAALRQRLEGASNEHWMDRIVGSMKDMPDFDEVVRYGREARQDQPPPEDVPA